METFTNKNDKQLHFNQIRGIINEMNDGDRYCSITLTVGHENTRNVNVSLRKNEFDSVINKFKIGDKVCVRFFLSSNKKGDRWYTSANALEITKDI